MALPTMLEQKKKRCVAHPAEFDVMTDNVLKKSLIILELQLKKAT